MLMEDLEDKEEAQPEYKIYCDMDGVVADFVKGVYKIIQNYDDEKYLKNPEYRNMMWKAIADYSKSGGKLWLELDMMPDGMVLWDYISKYDNTEILTASGDPQYGAPEQKVEWVKKHFGDVKTNVVRQSKMKAEFAAPNHILIDDMSKSIDPWVAAGGIGILLYILIVAAIGYYASTLGRSFIGWGLASVVFTPFLASLILLIIGKPEES